MPHANREAREGDNVIRTVLLDLGNVLVHFSHERMCDQVAAVCGVTAARVAAIVFEEICLHDRMDRGLISERQFHQEFQEAVGREIDFDALRLATSDIFELNAPMVPLIDQLRHRGIRLVVLSNTCDPHFGFLLKRFPVMRAFDDYVVSFREKAVKPEAAIFQAALKKIDCRPEECFYTDDIERFVIAGRTFGLQAEVFTGADDFVSQLASRGIVLAQ